jgi:hypothetical protein
MRMGMRRFTRLTNGFSKKVENLAHAVSLHYMHTTSPARTRPLREGRAADHPSDGRRRRAVPVERDTDRCAARLSTVGPALCRTVDAELPAFEQEVLSVVHAALSPHGGEAAAEVEVVWSAGMGGWFIEVTPRNVNAASVSVGCDGKELLLAFAHTRLELWDYKRGPSAIEQLSEFLPAIFSGAFEEAGFGSDRFARVNLPNGKTASVGAMHPPFPWALRRRKRYASYSDPPDPN